VFYILHIFFLASRRRRAGQDGLFMATFDVSLHRKLGSLDKLFLSILQLNDLS
jgi:hypothetical protein